MIIPLEISHIITIVIALLGFAWGIARLAYGQNKSSIEKLERSLNETNLNAERTKAEFPMIYVMRDDFVRTQSVIESKLDAISVRIDNLGLRDAK